MQFKRLYRFLSFVYIFLFAGWNIAEGQNDRFPVREYTNPEEVVTFDRSTPFPRALDVINEFAQEYRGKIILDRTNSTGEIGISIPTMHWMDALQLILRVKELQLVERPDFYEIVVPQDLQQQVSGQQQPTAGQGQDEEILATTQTKEVRINAIFFEGNRRALREIGVDWSTISENVPDELLGEGGQGQQQQGNQIPDSRFGQGPFVQVNSRGASNVSQQVFDAVINVGEIGNTGISVQSLFSAFEAENLGEILSSPTVKVMDGQEGRIQVGQDFSVKQRDFAGNVVEDFFSVGTILEVVPQIIEQNDTTFIHLTINAERSSAQPDPVSTIINIQEAETQALLLDGQATVIAGLYRTEQSQVRRGIPILKDLPPWFFGLRYLFGYTSNDYLLRELIILLQVSIEPTIPERIAAGVETNKFRELQKQREEIRDNIKESDKIFSGQQVGENLDLVDTEEEDTSRQEQQVQTQEQEQPQDEREPEGEETARQQQDEGEDKPETEQEQPETEEEEPAITDPEVQTRQIKLDFGTEKDTTEQQADDLEAEEDTILAEQQKEQQPAEDETPEDISDESTELANVYYIIGGSFSVDENAIEFRDELRTEGFNAVILEKADSSIQYVAYRGFDDINQAKKALADIRQYQNSDAWLYLVR